LRQLQRYDEALATLTRFLATNPEKELAASAEFSLGTIQKDTGKVDEAMKTYRGITEKYAGAPAAENAAFWVANLLMGKGQAKDAEAEFRKFIATFPQSESVPAATFALAQAQLADRQ
jgi:TolA-binding protein